MKKIISLFMCCSLLICPIFGFADSLESGVSSASVGEIKHFQQPNDLETFDHSDRPLEISVTVPKTYADATVMAAFYTEGVLTKVIPVQISDTSPKGIVKFHMTSYADDELPPTPDEIKIFTWDTGSLKPLTLSHNVLTESVVSAANARISLYVLACILGEQSQSSATDYIRDNVNFEIENHDKIDALLNKMDECAAIAYEQRNTHLLTSEYARRLFYDDIVESFNLLESDTAQKNEFIRIFKNLPSGTTGPKTVFKRLSYLLRIDISGFTGEN